MKHPDKIKQPTQNATANRLSTEPQADPSASTAHPSLAPGADFQPGHHQGNGVQFETPRADALMRRYNR